MFGSLRTFLWRSAIAAAIIVLILSAFYAEENARGRAAWKKVSEETKARGESLNWDDYIPRPVPDDQNFFQAPMMTEWFVRGANHVSSTPLPAMVNPQTDVNVISEISASDYIAWAATFEPQLNQIREALKRPGAHLTGDYTKPFATPIENFVNYRNVARILAHRAKCYLVLNQPEKAFEDVAMLDDLSRTLAKDGRPNSLVSAMIRVAITGLWVQVVAGGLETHAWRESDLVVLQKRLAEVNLLPSLVNAFKAECAGVCRILDQSAAQLLHNGQAQPPSDFGWSLIPSGWIDQNKALVVSIEGQMIDSVDLTNQTISVFKAKATNTRLNDAFRRLTPWNFFAATCIPNFTKAAETAGRNQTWADQAQIVCALERYRLAHGTYPASLSDLVSAFIPALPHDIINGKPLNYSRQDDSHFRLYSVGWNESDDGGLTAHKSDGTEDSDNGDWVWHDPVL